MDALTIHLKGGGFAWGAGAKQEQGAAAVARGSSSWRAFVAGEEGCGGRTEVRVRVRVRVSSRRWRNSRPVRRLIAVHASGKNKNDDNPSPSGDNPLIPDEDGSEQVNSTNDKSELDSAHNGINPASDKSELNSTHESQVLLDWRDFRANLVAGKQVHLIDSDAPAQDSAANVPAQRLGLKWAHPIPVLETGCVLVATEKLDGVPSFERSVVLLLRLGTRDPREGPYGVIINRPMQKKIKHMKPSNPDLATTFADCAIHFGGPLEASMFLLKNSKKSPVPGFEQLVPGICFGARNNLNEAAMLVRKGALKAQDFNFFVGYAGWQLDQLREEIDSDYWVIAACSSHLIGNASADSSSDLWGEILQLMGGQYSELSRKPKQDSS